MTKGQQSPAPTGFPPVTEARLQEVAQRIKVKLSMHERDKALAWVDKVEEAREAVEAMKTVRRFVRNKCG